MHSILQERCPCTAGRAKASLLRSVKNQWQLQGKARSLISAALGDGMVEDAPIGFPRLPQTLAPRGSVAFESLTR